MPRTRYRTEQSVTKLRQAEVELSRGLRPPQVCKKIGVGAAIGDLIGGLTGGKKGALTGTAIGGGAGTAVVLSTSGDEVDRRAWSPVQVDLTESLTVRHLSSGSP